MTEMKTTRRTWLRGLAAAGLILATPRLMAEDAKSVSVSKETKETEKDASKETEKETEKDTSKEAEKETEKETEKGSGKESEKESEKDSEKESCDSGASAAPELASYPMLILSGTAIVSFILGRQVGARKKS